MKDERKKYIIVDAKDINITLRKRVRVSGFNDFWNEYQEVGETKEYVDTVLENSKTNGEVKDRIAETGKTLDTDGDKTVTDISSIVPSEQPQE